MRYSLWERTAYPLESGEMSWEQFHESSKTGHYDAAPPRELVVAEMANMPSSLPYDHFPAIPLPATLSPIAASFRDIVLTRATPHDIKPAPMSLEQLRTVLHFAYGETRPNTNHAYIRRPFRTVASGGALYPLELYFHNGGQIEGLELGIYHYSPSLNAVKRIRPGDHSAEIARALVEFQSGLSRTLSTIIFITAILQRATFKYRNKGYRFALLEAGHVAQNINLTAVALGMSAINIGGYYDRLVDKMLDLDGLNHSVLYMNGICAGASDAR